MYDIITDLKLNRNLWISRTGVKLEERQLRREEIFSIIVEKSV